MYGPQIWLCLFSFWPITSRHLTTIDTLNWLSGAVVTHPLWVQEVSGSNPGSGKGFSVWFFCFVVVVFLLFCPKTNYLSKHFAISFAMLIYVVYLTYCKICDRLWGYKDTDLASLIKEKNDKTILINIVDSLSFFVLFFSVHNSILLLADVIKNCILAMHFYKLSILANFGEI